MEIRFKKLELIGVTAVLLILWLVFVVWRFESMVSIAIAVLLFVIMCVIALLPKRVVIGKPAVDDERLKKMHRYAGSYSWDVTFLFVCILTVAVYARIIELDAKQIIALVLYGMGLTRAGFYAYFQRRGDVQ